MTRVVLFLYSPGLIQRVLKSPKQAPCHQEYSRMTRCESAASFPLANLSSYRTDTLARVSNLLMGHPLPCSPAAESRHG